jgi:hypothetical protein
MADTIPFYLQLLAPSESLQAFLGSTLPAHTEPKRSKSISSELTTPPNVRVYLLRQVTVVLKGHFSTHNFTIGEGTLRSLPPGASSPSSSLRSETLTNGHSTLDYEGEVHPNSNITVGQFCTSQLQVRVR